MQDVDAMGTYNNGRGNPLCVHRHLVYSYERHYGRPTRVFFYSLVKKSNPDTDYVVSAYLIY